MTGHDLPPLPHQLQDDVTAGPGGAMTDEVGILTGDLTIATRALPGGHASITVQYTGAEEWYTLTGSPAPLPRDGLAALHADVLQRVRQGGGAVAH
ncbi:hypothetical protein SSP35_22_00920 [Streptomyces sp. NBRC 110611]|uniref:hypothetical protein n=1 Tax=Streptomyces sp. NBRC 110611 TaxID=1621259 RepID=UPI00082A1F1B|nr:hypothetical protein [Streptomyces sp. NBRC 110611]GAU70788.1 hypothetical protein SSP35_22_00920 [Streptomyces sp. NBRC 110611]